jgi:hypothetical protein
MAPLRQMVKKSFFNSLLVSPVEAWVTLRGHITDYRFAGVRVVHSELSGKYDALAMEMVKYIKLPSGWEPLTGTHVSSRRVRFDVLVYAIKDGKMAIGFPQLDEAEGTVVLYYGLPLWLLKKVGNGSWSTRDSGVERDALVQFAFFGNNSHERLGDSTAIAHITELL